VEIWTMLASASQRWSMPGVPIIPFRNWFASPRGSNIMAHTLAVTTEERTAGEYRAIWNTRLPLLREAISTPNSREATKMGMKTPRQKVAEARTEFQKSGEESTFA
jgi:hypothetical protein